MPARLGAVLCVGAVAAGIGFATPSYAEVPTKPIQCVKQDRLLIGPVVSTARAAKEIYAAVARAPQLHKLEGRGPVVATDEGDKWGVTHYLEPKIGFSHHGKYETVEVVAGGGDLAMEIDKCTGAVSMMLNR